MASIFWFNMSPLLFKGGGQYILVPIRSEASQLRNCNHIHVFLCKIEISFLNFLFGHHLEFDTGRVMNE